MLEKPHLDSEIRDLLKSIYPVSRETIERLQVFHKLLKQWQSKTNLVAPSTLDQFWHRHIADSLQILAIAPNARHWTDIGSGGGFPGLVIAIVMQQIAEEEGSVTSVRLIESIQKKCSFLRRVGVEAKVDVDVQAIRIESASKQLDDCEVITARALTSLGNLLDLTGTHITGEKIALFHKGRDYLSEIEDCRGKWNFDLVVHTSKIDADSVVLEISNVERLAR